MNKEIAILEATNWNIMEFQIITKETLLTFLYLSLLFSQGTVIWP